MAQMTMKEVLTKLQERYHNLKLKDVKSARYELEDFLTEKLGFKFHYSEVAYHQGVRVYRYVDYDHVCLEDEFNKYRDGRTMWEVFILSEKAEMHFGKRWYDITDKVQSNAERDIVLAKIAKLDKSIDKYTEYIDNYRQQKSAEEANERIYEEIENLKKYL